MLSTTIAIPCPPPMQAVASPYFFFRRCSSYSSVITSRDRDAAGDHAAVRTASAEEEVWAGHGLHWRGAGDCDGGGEHELIFATDLHGFHGSTAKTEA